MTNYIHVADLVLPEGRHRTEFPEEYIEELAESIRDNGLIHPIALRDDGVTLVAGECRTRAMTLLHERGATFYHGGQPVPDFMLPYTRMGEMDELGRETAELEENLRRRNLSWQDEARAQARLHKLRQQADPTWTMQDTSAELLGIPPSRAHTASTRLMREAAALTAHMDDPTVAKAKTRNEALKALKKYSEGVLIEALADITRDTVAEPSHRFLKGDALEQTQQLDDDSFDLIITDPPYGIGADSFGDQAKGVHLYDDSPSAFRELMRQLIPELYRVAKPEAHLYMFCAWQHWEFLVGELVHADWNPWTPPLIWAKSNGMLPRPEHGPRRTYELILYAIKGNRPVVHSGAPDVISIPQEPEQVHAAQKPRELYRELISRSCYPGDSIFDPFAGRGTVFLAAPLCGVRATGIELNETMAARCELAARGEI